MRPMICKQCGGIINPDIMRCEYCGTYYERKQDFITPIVLHTEQSHIEVLEGSASFENYLLRELNPEDLNKMIRSELTRKLVEALEPYVDYKVFNDVPYNRHIVRGRVRVLPPDYRF